MKRLFALLCVLALAVSLAACGKEEENAPAASGGYAVEEMDLTEAMEAILKDVPNLPDYEIAELTEENFEFFAFLPYAEGVQGVTADALINAMPHSVVLVRVAGGTEEAEKAEETIRSSADPRKWICVGAEKTVVRRYGDTILLVMSQAETANAILQNFDALNGVETPEADLAIPEREDADGGQLEPLPDDVLNQPAALPEEEPVDMPTMAPDEDETDNMPALEDDGSAVPIPTPAPAQPDPPQPIPIQPDPAPVQPVQPAQPDPQPVQPVQPAQPEPAPAPTEPEAPAAAETDLEAVMASILGGVDIPDCLNMELTAENFEFVAFIPYAEGWRGLSADPIIGSIPHSVVLVEVPEGGDAAAAAAAMQESADPRKWICVEAESVQTASKGRLALLVMSSQAAADAIIANFNAM
ncbi:MAG: hypothetical protein HFF17_06615 [Oscillospiraceae bacterium]|nr:hypothetical protein [Oscillospiraceae bacterium]